MKLSLPLIPYSISDVLITFLSTTRRNLLDWADRLDGSFVTQYTVTSADVTAGEFTISTGFTALSGWAYRMRGAATNAELAGTWTVAVSGGDITVTNAGGTPYVAGDIFMAWATGR